MSDRLRLFKKYYCSRITISVLCGFMASAAPLRCFLLEMEGILGLVAAELLPHQPTLSIVLELTSISVLYV